MNNKERINELEDYKALIESRLVAPIPPKHISNPKSFKAYLENELRLVKAKLEKLRAI
jgi:hypothetical protein